MTVGPIVGADDRVRHEGDGGVTSRLFSYPAVGGLLADVLTKADRLSVHGNFRLGSLLLEFWSFHGGTLLHLLGLVCTTAHFQDSYL